MRPVFALEALSIGRKRTIRSAQSPFVP